MEQENKSEWRYDFDEEYGENNENVEETQKLSRREQEAQVRQTLFEMMLGIVLAALVLFLIGGLLFRWKISFILGMLAGTAAAELLAVLMYFSVLVAAELPEEKASGYMIRMSVLRMVIMIVVIGAAVYFLQSYGLLGAMFGVMTLKLSAFLCPVIHKYIPYPGKKK